MQIIFIADILWHYILSSLLSLSVSTFFQSYPLSNEQEQPT